MTNRSLPQVTTASSKAEELKFLETVLSQISEGSYMSLFFTPDLVSWLERQIHDDFSCDLFVDYESLKSSSEVSIANKDQEIRDLREQLVTEKSYSTARHTDYEEIRTRYYREQAETNEFMSQATTENKDLRARLDKLELENIGLKAKLWDLSQLIPDRNIPPQSERPAGFEDC